MSSYVIPFWAFSENFALLSLSPTILIVTSSFFIFHMAGGFLSLLILTAGLTKRFAFFCQTSRIPCSNHRLEYHLILELSFDSTSPPQRHYRPPTIPERTAFEAKGNVVHGIFKALSQEKAVLITNFHKNIFGDVSAYVSCLSKGKPITESFSKFTSTRLCWDQTTTAGSTMSTS